MAVEIKEVTQDRIEAATEAAVRGADLVSGAVATTADAVTHPAETAKTLERRGAKVNRALVDDIQEVVEPLMPERVLLAGIRAIKGRARRRDRVGSIAYRALELLNGGFEDLEGIARRFGRATEPPARHAEAYRPVSNAIRKASRSTARSARRGASKARRGERRSA